MTTDDNTKRDFDPDWPHGHVTDPENRPARIICRDAKGYKPIVALVGGDDMEAVYRFHVDGASGGSYYALVNAPAPKKRIQGWANVYRDSDGSGCLFFYPTREAANSRDRPTRLACVYFDIEEGEGL